MEGQLGKKKVWKDPSQVPEEAVPEQFKKDGSYRPGGYHCWQCDFVTSKKGFSGRQALRAHIKSHRLARRFWVRPLQWQGMMIMAAMVAFVAHRLGLPLAAPPWTATISLTEVRIGVAAGGLLLAVALLATISPRVEPTPGRLRMIQLGRLVATLALVFEGGWHLGVFEGHITWGLHLAAWGMGLTGVWLAVAQGKMIHALKRRRRRSDEYGELYAARDENSVLQLLDWLKRQAGGVQRAVANGRGRYPPSRSPRLR